MTDKYILPTYGRYPVTFTKGKGSRLWGADGKEYIDFASGIGVNSVGHSHPKWVEAVCNQAATLVHVSNLFYTTPGAELAEKLCQLAKLGENSGVFFCNSGAESVEGAIKAARKYSNDKYGAGRHTIITLEGSFHGRTMAALTATGQKKFHQHFHPFLPGFRYVKPNDIGALKAFAQTRRQEDSRSGEICAVLLEPIQGEGGVMPLCKDYLQQVADLCAANDWLLITDEVQTGIGRTGAWFAYQNCGITPDAVTFAKGIAGGLPLGGFILGEKMHKTLGKGDHGTTYGGNPLCTTAALAVLEILQPEMEAIKKKGGYIREKIAAMNKPCITEIRGEGLMLGCKLSDIAHTETVSKLLEAGLVALPAGDDILRFLPPLTISYEEIDIAIEIINKTL